MSLEAAFVPEGVASLEAEVFAGCSKLADVSLPSTLEYVDDSAFSGCTALGR